MARHSFRGLRNDFQYGPPPSRVDGRNRPISGICHQNGETVGCSHRQSEAGLTGYEGVAFTQVARVFGYNYFVGMDLSNCREVGCIRPVRTEAGAEAMLQPRDLLEHLCAIHVSDVEAKQPSLYPLLTELPQRY
jgi:hypothetical protein